MSDAESSALGTNPSAELPATSAPKSAPSRLEMRITRGAGSSSAQPRGDFEPVEVRQLHVHDRHVRAVCRRFLDPTGAGVGFGDDGEAGPLEQLSRRGAEGAVVVDDENAMIHLLIVPARVRSMVWPAPLFFAASGASVVRVVTTDKAYSGRGGDTSPRVRPVRSPSLQPRGRRSG